MQRRQHQLSRLYYGVSLIAIAAYIARHYAAGFALPVPWPDESSFLWQAIGVQRAWSLFSPELNPVREIMWMPPAYMWCIGLLFDVVGASLEAARSFSLVCMIGAFGFLAATLRRHPYPLLSIIALSLIFYSAPLVVTGNVARMDSLALLFGAAAMYCFDRKHDIAGLTILAVSPLIHPGAASLCIAAAGYMITGGQWRQLRFSRSMIIAIAIVAAAWGLFALHALNHWSDIQADLSYQFLLRKIKPRPMFDFPNLLFLGEFVIVVFVGVRHNVKFLVVTWFGVAFWSMYALGTEAWYESYFIIGMVLMMLTMAPVIVGVARKWNPVWSPITAPRHLLREAALLIVLLIGYRAYTNIAFQIDNGSGGWHGMRVEDNGVPYCAAGDRRFVKEYLTELQLRNAPVLVQFFPEADAMFYADMETSTLRFCQGAFYNFAADVYIVHTSRYIPQWWMTDMQRKFNAMGMGDSSKIRGLVHRDSSESVVGFAYPYGQSYK